MYSTLSTKLILWNRWFSLASAYAGPPLSGGCYQLLYPFYISLSHQKSIRIYIYIYIYILIQYMGMDQYLLIPFLVG